MAYDFQKTSVLIVEDCIPMMHLLKNVLHSFGIKAIITATNGEDAFSKYCTLNPDLVITDWMMGPRDGLDLCKDIRNHPKSPNQFVPIILMTGFTDQKHVFSSRDAGITEFLMKPFNTRDLYKRICRIIEKPRVFVKSENFFGPDRRRTKNTGNIGMGRREEDDSNNDNLEINDIEFI